MTVKLSVKVELKTAESHGFVGQSLSAWIRALLLEDPELLDPDDPTYVIGIIQDVEVRVR